MKLFAPLILLASLQPICAQSESVKFIEVSAQYQAGNLSFFKMNDGRLILTESGSYGPSKDGGAIEFNGPTATLTTTDGNGVVFESTWKDATGKNQSVKTNCNGFTLEKCAELHIAAVTLLQAKYPPVAGMIRYKRISNIFNFYDFVPRITARQAA